MDSHPVTIVRFAANVALVVVIAAFLASAMLGVGPGPLSWMWIIFATALGGMILTFAASAVWRRGLEASFDEQVRRSDAASYVFGYWITLAVFLSLLGAVRLGGIPAATAFYWLGTPLAVAPALWMAAAFLRGRAG